jgi:D-aspartate ligase
MSVPDRTSVALVLDMSSTGLGVARSLGREGIRVLGTDFRPDAPGLKSRYCKSFLTPDPVRCPEEVLDRLLREGKRLPKKGILYAASDPYVLFASRFRKALSEYFLFAIPSEDIVECILDKSKQNELARRVGIPCPKSYYPRDLDGLKLIEDRIEYPAFVKPCYAHLWRERFRGKGFKVNSREQLFKKYAEVLETGLEAMVQEVIAGPSANIVEVNAYISKEGDAIAVFATRKVRQYPVEFGVGTCLESIHNKDVLSLALRYLQGIHYRGIGAVEFKRDNRDETYKLVELNARSWTQVIQATCAGINFPLIQYLDLTNQPIPKSGDYQDGIKWLDAAPDFLAFYESYQGREPWPLAWLRSIWGARCYAYYSHDDPKPFLKEHSKNLIKLTRRMLVAGTSFTSEEEARSGTILSPRDDAKQQRHRSDPWFRGSARKSKTTTYANPPDG